MITKETLIDFFNDLKNDGEFDTSKPLLYSYFFTDENQTKLIELSKVLKKLDFEIVDILDAEIEGGEIPFFYLQIEKNEIHNADSLDLRNKEFYKLAEKYDLDSYDGFDIGKVEN